LGRRNSRSVSYFGRVVKLSEEESRAVDEGLVSFNAPVVPFTQSEPFVRMRYGIRDDSGTLIAGITATLYCWGIL
jgi:hypothetical protein